MKNIKDNRGYNQVWRETKAMKVRTDRRSDRIITEMDHHRNINVLEIGCGTGEMSFLMAKRLPKSRILGTDLCRPFINSASKSYKLNNLEYKLLDFNKDSEIERLIGKRKFDYIIGNGILHHLFYNLDQTARQFNKLLKQNGKILFWEPSIANPYCLLIFKIPILRKLTSLEPAEMAFSGRHITKILSKSGFSGIGVAHEDFLLPNTPDILINSVIKIGSIMEKVPLAKLLSQSIFISATKNRSLNKNGR